MNALVKSHDGSLQGRVQAFRSRSHFQGESDRPKVAKTAPNCATETSPIEQRPAKPAANAETKALANEADVLKLRIASLEAALEEARTELEQSAKARFDEGRKAGLEDAEKLDRERVDLLDKALQAAAKIADEAWTSTQSLSLAIAGVAIDKVFGDKASLRQAVEASIEQQLAAIRPEVVSRLRVSARDFTDEQAVADIANKCVFVVECDPALEPGSCIFDLSLGRLDASIGKQRQAILELLDGIAEGEVEP